MLCLLSSIKRRILTELIEKQVWYLTLHLFYYPSELIVYMMNVIRTNQERQRCGVMRNLLIEAGCPQKISPRTSFEMTREI